MRGSAELFVSKAWQALPSCCAEEQLLDLYISNNNWQEFEIKKSTIDHLYYIRFLSENPCPKEVHIDYVLKMPAHYRTKPLLNVIALNQTHPR